MISCSLCATALYAMLLQSSRVVKLGRLRFGWGSRVQSIIRVLNAYPIGTSQREPSNGQPTQILAIFSFDKNAYLFLHGNTTQKSWKEE